MSSAFSSVPPPGFPDTNTPKVNTSFHILSVNPSQVTSQDTPGSSIKPTRTHTGETIIKSSTLYLRRAAYGDSYKELVVKDISLTTAAYY